MAWRDLVRRFFYPVMSLVIAGIVIYGFSFTVNENLFHPAYPRPWILYVHAAIFTAWLPFFILQASLISATNVKLHRALGWYGVFFGAALVVIGIGTAITMTGLRVSHGELDEASSFLIPLFDSFAFALGFSLAVIWRRRTEYHRRLMYVAMCVLTAAAFGRFPGIEKEWFYVGVDSLVLLGALRDLAVTGSVHTVYRWALPCLILGQSLLAYIRWSPQWMVYSLQLFQ
jgi:hypothetical protein